MTQQTQQLAKEHTALAKALNVSISTKQSVVISKFLRNKSTSFAKQYLADVVALKKSIPFPRFNNDMGHKAGISSGRYPQKAAAQFLHLVKSVEANAQSKGLDTGNLKIVKILANKASTPMTGGRHRQGTKRSHIEIVVAESKDTAKKTKKVAQKPQVKKDVEKETSVKPDVKKEEPKADVKKPEVKKEVPKVAPANEETKVEAPKVEEKLVEKPVEVQEEKAKPVAEPKPVVEAPKESQSEKLQEEKKEEPAKEAPSPQVEEKKQIPTEKKEEAAVPVEEKKAAEPQVVIEAKPEPTVVKSVSPEPVVQEPKAQVPTTESLPVTNMVVEDIPAQPSMQEKKPEPVVEASPEELLARAQAKAAELNKKEKKDKETGDVEKLFEALQKKGTLRNERSGKQ